MPLLHDGRADSSASMNAARQIRPHEGPAAWAFFSVSFMCAPWKRRQVPQDPFRASLCHIYLFPELLFVHFTVHLF
jgi:hypothetical protein